MTSQYHTFKIQDNTNGYYYYTVSDIDDTDFVLDIRDSYAEDAGDVPINAYFNIIGFDNVTCTKCPEISPTQVVNKQYPHDPKNMLTSDEFKKVIEEAVAVEAEKKSKKGKSKPKPAPKEPKQKATPKPRAKKSSNVTIEPGKTVDFAN